MAATLPKEIRALAEGDFGEVAARFAQAGFTVGLPAKGVLTVKAATPSAERAAVLLSVGVHGDETGPIEMAAYAIEALSRTPSALAVDLMLCVGNIDAIAAGKRFIDADLNRMFRDQRGDLAGTFEAGRADTLIAATAAFFDGSGPRRWHLDLHTAIRGSRYPRFAIVPELIADGPRRALIAWLGLGGIEAVIMNPASAGTYSYWTAERHGAAGTTVELGRIGTLGQNDLSQFAAMASALHGLLRGQAQAGGNQPIVFNTAQSITKLSDAFTMSFGRDTENFTPLKKGDVIARDGDTVYTVQHDEECVVFPNPDVRVGLRAGIMVVRAG
ncbi:succinylglutamate desuccinylase [Massilia sp. NEAU-DD11]|jgi:succinylglutamate desuccinylase|uniref:Succinylglutamate desuccinylase n=1 Tax=Massilia cellulosiltytica TaxID=2683234 RepID=A0A7X3KAS9_9BURK|nr:succinylglutamate desuccinylase [Telluria cellulosilytica]MVW64353.1 succinylglutamate desuccinylase [Telluria cellulosilytica]